LVWADYEQDIKPLLAARCTKCHGAVRHKAGLRLDTVAAIRKGGDSGAVVVPRDSANSLLIAVVSGADDVPCMPPSGEPLEPGQIALLKAWVDNGAPAPDEESPSSIVSDHWAFRPPSRSALPAAQDQAGARNPVDAFLAVTHEEKGLIPNPPIAPSLLLRRLYLDLVGYPPTRADARAFLADPSDQAYEKVVDRLLASPQYGERWGRHWMDVWRYSDPDGRKSKKDIWWSNDNIWRWRDWIIRSLNADKGYDRMLTEMLAGDEVAPDSPDALIATGFLVRSWFKLDRNIWLNNTVEHTGKAFLGLTLNCARCHDHKFDPLSQEEYYRFRAYFQPHDIRTEPVPLSPGGPCVTIAHACDAHPTEPTWIFVRGDLRTPDTTRPVTPGVPRALGPPGNPVEPTPIGPAELPGTGRRLALARWMCDRQNPLTARVAVNHIWARHFGQPLVEHVYDFGRRTPPPPLQPVLDWLAVEFMAHNWSQKWLHRLLVTSALYRRSSTLAGVSANNLTVDPDNQYYWRMNARRMEAEVVRDSLLYLGGDIDWTMGGPPLDCLDGPGSARRSVYHRYSRGDKMVFLTTFDAAAVEECYRRHESIVPEQALALSNSDFSWDQARRIARRIEGDLAAEGGRTVPERGAVPFVSPSTAFVTAAFGVVLGRAPEPAEAKACAGFLADQERLLADPARLRAFPAVSASAVREPKLPKDHALPLTYGTGRRLPRLLPADDARGRARESLIHALLNHNDFLTIR
jgi:hypothetical protein